MDGRVALDEVVTFPFEVAKVRLEVFGLGVARSGGEKRDVAGPNQRRDALCVPGSGDAALPGHGATSVRLNLIARLRGPAPIL